MENLDEQALAQANRAQLAAYITHLRASQAQLQQQLAALAAAQQPAMDAQALAAALVRATASRDALVAHPVFDEGASVPEFLRAAVRVLTDAELPEAEWPKTSARYLRGQASKWAEQEAQARRLVLADLQPLVQGGPVPARTTWLEFKQMLAARFTPLGEQQRLKDDLGRLRMEVGGLEAFIAAAKGLARDMEGVSDADKVDKFVAGLSKKIKLAVQQARLLSPASAHFGDLDHVAEFARGLARVEEDAGRAEVVGGKKAAAVAVHGLDTTSSRRRGFDSDRVAKAHGLDPVEVARRRDAGLCFHCGKSWERGHKCP